MEPSYPCERRTLKPLRWNQMRPVTTALVALVAAVLAWLPATHSQAQPGARTTLYVGSGEMGVSAQSKLPDDIAQKLTEQLGVSVVVDNRTGAGVSTRRANLPGWSP